MYKCDKDKQKTKDKSERVLMMNLSLACSVVPLLHDKNLTRPEQAVLRLLSYSNVLSDT